MRRWSKRSVSFSPSAPSTVRAIARCGPGCGTQACARPSPANPGATLAWLHRLGSTRRVLRLMREHGLLAPSRVGSPRGPRNHDGTIIPDTVDTMWGTDMTTTAVRPASGRTWDRRRPNRGLRRSGSLQRRVRRHSCRTSRHPLRGFGAAAPGCAPLLRRVRQRRSLRSRRPPRPRQPVHVRRVPDRAALLRHRGATGFW